MKAEIDGISEETANRLLTHFANLSLQKSNTLKALENVVNERIESLVTEYQIEIIRIQIKIETSNRFFKWYYKRQLKKWEATHEKYKSIFNKLNHEKIN